MKKILGFVLCGVLSITLVGCGGKTTSEGGEVEGDKISLTVGGSTSVQPLMEIMAEEFNAENDASVTVQGGGSSVGMKGAMDGTFNVGMASRDLKEEEMEALDYTEIALDGIVVILNKENEVKDLSMDDLYKIYTGEITNWNEVGGADAEIAVVSREDGSGTRDAFDSIVGFETDELVESASIQNATGAVSTTVVGNPNAIGYVSLGGVSEETNTITVDGVEGTVETILDGSYKLQRPFNLAVEKGYEGAQVFYDFIFSDAGKAIIEDHDYIPVEAK